MTTPPSTGEATALDWRTRALIRAGAWVMVALGRTWRVRVFGREALVARRAGDAPVVYVLWHGQILPCFLRAHAAGRRADQRAS